MKHMVFLKKSRVKATSHPSEASLAQLSGPGSFQNTPEFPDTLTSGKYFSLFSKHIPSQEAMVYVSQGEKLQLESNASKGFKWGLVSLETRLLLVVIHIFRYDVSSAWISWQ